MLRHAVLCFVFSAILSCGDNDNEQVRELGLEPSALSETAVPESRSSNEVPSKRSSVSSAVASPASKAGNVVPVVRAIETYDVVKSTSIYGQGLNHESWGKQTALSGLPMDLLLDVYEPIHAPPNRPLFVFIHGGGFLGGTRDEKNMVEFCQFFASRGFIAASLDYRLAKHRGTVPSEWATYVKALTGGNERMQASGMAIYPAARDVKTAIRWLVTEADTYEINTEFLTVAGSSAGGVLAVTAGVTSPGDYRDELDISVDPTLASVNADVSFEVSTVLDFWGSNIAVHALGLVWDRWRFDAGDPALMIVHGTEDQVVSFKEAESLAHIYTQTRAPFVFHRLEGVGHSGWNALIDGKSLVETSFDYVIETQGLSVK